MRRITLALIIFTFSLISVAIANEAASNKTPETQAYFISPVDGQTVQSPFKVQFGLKGMGVAPAGVQKENTGHHHLLIDTDISTVDLTKPLPATDKIKHFGGGQTETYLELPAGKHTLQLVLGNYLHIPHSNPIASDRITVKVE